MVAVGEEITAPRYHLIAVGIEQTVPWREDPERAIEEVHAQGGATIAAHPFGTMWAGWNDGALRRLDGAEICHPLAYRDGTADLGAFFRRFESQHGRGAPIGSSDWHVFGSLGLCRTFVFATARTERALVEAVRAGRTVSFDVEGTLHGDPALVALLGTPPPPPAEPNWQTVLALAGRICALAGMAGVLLLRSRRTA